MRRVLASLGRYVDRLSANDPTAARWPVVIFLVLVVLVTGVVLGAINGNVRAGVLYWAAVSVVLCAGQVVSSRWRRRRTGR